MIRSSIVYGLIVTLFSLSLSVVGYAAEDTDVLQLLSLSQEGESKSTSSGNKDTEQPKETSFSLESETKSTFLPSENVSKNTPHSSTRSLLEEYKNMSVWQFYLGIRGGGAATGTYGRLTGTSINYIGIGAHPVVGGILGMGIQTTPNFTFRLGLGVEHLFKMKRFIVGIDENDPNIISNDKQTIEKTSVLGEVYFDFHSGLWSSFFIKLAGGYSWVTIDGTSENGPTAGIGLGVRWYAHKYVTLDWTILDAKATFAKNISGDLGTQIGITFQY